MNVDMQKDAERKIKQMAGTPCGVLVRNEAGALAAVSDMGRVTWLDDCVTHGNCKGQCVLPDQGSHACQMNSDMNGQCMVCEQPARAQGEQEEDGKGSLPWFVHVYNSGYEAGHHDTVEGGFTPIHHSDKDAYHEDQVLEILEDLNVQASRDPQPAQQDMYRRLADKYRQDLFACQDELNNLRSKYHNKMAELEGEIEELRSAQQGSVPDEAVNLARKWLGMTEGGLLHNDDITKMAEALVATPRPEGDGWIKCSERLPTGADADCRSDVWVHDKAMCSDKYRQCLARWNTVGRISDYTHWMPTGLKRPQPPVEQGEG